MLDNLPWHALNTDQAWLALCAPSARKYPADVAPFGGTADNSREAWQQLVSLLEVEETVFVASDVPPNIAGCGERLFALQMMAGDEGKTRRDEEAVTLGAEDADAMVALTTLAFPGFYRSRTHVMGNYYGIRVRGELVAMAGERMAIPGYREISGVCTHPAHTGKGYAARLLQHVMESQARAGVRPFLHVSSDNTRAIALYTRLGFTVRREVTIYPLSRED